MNKEYYISSLEEMRRKKEKLKEKYERISLKRLITVIAAIFIMAANLEPEIKLIIIVFVFLFLYYVNLHVRVEKEIWQCEAAQKVIESYISRYDEQWRNSDREGTEFSDERGKDLDIFGKISLYKFICASYTQRGRKKLANILKNGCTDIDEILDNQEAVRELLEKENFSELFEYRLAYFENKNKHKADDFISKDNSGSINVLIKVLSFLLPLVTVIGILLTIFTDNGGVTATIAILSGGMSFVLCCIENAIKGGILRELEKTRNNLNSYYDVIELLEKENFSSKKLVKLKNVFSDSDALKQIKKICFISGLAEMCSNFFASFFLNIFLMWDVHCINLYDKWCRKNVGMPDKWLDAISEIEMLISFLVIPKVSDVYTYPEINKSDKPFISFKNLCHPLISSEKVVGNSADFESSTVIITGSNMSGKTTFIRSVGIAVVLAKAGAPVTAGGFSMSFMDIMTSIRTEDNVGEGISSFYAELLRIKGMVEYAQNGKLSIMLVDEIFKGTNSKDRIICAIETIKRLSGNNTIVMVTTHDFELCSVDFKNEKTINLHFSEYYEDDRIMFDYKLKEGRCTTTNAQELLKMVGIK